MNTEPIVIEKNETKNKKDEVKIDLTGTTGHFKNYMTHYSGISLALAKAPMKFQFEEEGQKYQVTVASFDDVGKSIQKIYPRLSWDTLVDVYWCLKNKRNHKTLGQMKVDIKLVEDFIARVEASKKAVLASKKKEEERKAKALSVVKKMLKKKAETKPVPVVAETQLATV